MEKVERALEVQELAQDEDDRSVGSRRPKTYREMVEERLVLEVGSATKLRYSQS